MKRLLPLLACAFAAHGFSQNSPKLIVGIVVDQMRTDYIYRYWDKFEEGGFKRLVGEGFFCRNAHYSYVPTFTAPGHASIYTGATPMTHGIIGNAWFDKTTGKMCYCVGDASVAGVGTTTKSGKMSPANLLAPTLGDAVRAADLFKGKSIGISIKDRSAVLPAGHSANAAYWLDYQSGDLVSSTYYMDKLPKWVEKFNKEDHPDRLAKDGWETMLAIEKYTESTVDNTPYEESIVKGTPPVFPYDVMAAVKQGDYRTFAATPFGNTLLRLFADHCVTNEDLGQDDHTDLLAISFSSPDLIGHTYGPQSIEVEDTYLRLDRDLAVLLQMLDTRVGAGNYLLFLTADHAAAHVPQYLKAHKIPVGQIDDDALEAGIKNALAQKFGTDALFLNYSNEQVFLNHTEMKKLGVEEKAVYQCVRDFVMTVPGIANAVDVKQLQHPLPPDLFSKLAAKGWHPQRSGDIFIQFLPGWMEYGHTGTTHGSSYSYDTHVPVLFYGFGVPHGESTDVVEITQIVPTVSLISRIAFPDASDHRPIKFD